MIYEKIGDVEISNFGIIWNLCSNPNYIAALPNIPNIIHHRIPCSKQKSSFIPSFSTITQPKQIKTSRRNKKKLPIFNLQPPQPTPQPTPPTNQHSNQPLPLNGSHPDTLGVDVSPLLVKVVRALEPPPAAHIPESVEALVASLPSMPWVFFEKSVDDLLIHCRVVGSEGKKW